MVEIWKKLEGVEASLACIESTALIEAPRWLREARGLGSVSWWGLGCPLPEKAWIFFPEMAHFGVFGFIQEFIWKSYNVIPTQLYCPWSSGFGSASFLFQSVLPIGLYSTAVSHPTSWLDCRKSICQNRIFGIAWCTHWFDVPLGIPIPGSWPIFSIPNPGIGDALISGFRDYEKCNKMPEFYRIFARKIPFPGILGAIPGSKAESERIRPPTPTTLSWWTSFYGCNRAK